LPLVSWSRRPAAPMQRMGPSLIHGMQGVIGFFQRWIIEPSRFQLCFDALLNSFRIGEGLVGPKPVFALEIAGLLQEPNSVPVSITLRIVQIAHLERAVRLVRFGEAPI